MHLILLSQTSLLSGLRRRMDLGLLCSALHGALLFTAPTLQHTTDSSISATAIAASISGSSASDSKQQCRHADDEWSDPGFNELLARGLQQAQLQLVLTLAVSGSSSSSSSSSGVHVNSVSDSSDSGANGNGVDSSEELRQCKGVLREMAARIAQLENELLARQQQQQQQQQLS
jgi:hypothetical protein